MSEPRKHSYAFIEYDSWWIYWVWNRKRNKQQFSIKNSICIWKMKTLSHNTCEWNKDRENISSQRTRCVDWFEWWWWIAHVVSVRRNHTTIHIIRIHYPLWVFGNFGHSNKIVFETNSILHYTCWQTHTHITSHLTQHSSTTINHLSVQKSIVKCDVRTYAHRCEGQWSSYGLWLEFLFPPY